MKRVNMHEAKTHFSALIADVEDGDDIIICRAGKPVARIVPAQKPTEKRKLGRDEGLPFYIADDFDEFIPPEWDGYIK